MPYKVFSKSLAIVMAIAFSVSVGAMPPSQAAVLDDETDEMPSVLASPERPLAAGRVVSTDLNAGMIVIQHRPIWNFSMPEMTMVFRVKDPILLTGLTPGDKIRFRVEREGGSYVITYIENSN